MKIAKALFIFAALLCVLPVVVGSGGSCYDPVTQVITCDVPEPNCGAGTYYKPGYVDPDNGCCHCSAACDHAVETIAESDPRCTYYDAVTAPQTHRDHYLFKSDAAAERQIAGRSILQTVGRPGGSCTKTNGAIACDIQLAECEALGGLFEQPGSWNEVGCCICNIPEGVCDHGAETGTNCMHATNYHDETGEELQYTGYATSSGSCYDSVNHITSCDIDESTCSAFGQNLWYPPGFVGSSGCCHCYGSCAHSTESGGNGISPGEPGGCTYIYAPCCNPDIGFCGNVCCNDVCIATLDLCVTPC